MLDLDILSSLDTICMIHGPSEYPVCEELQGENHSSILEQLPIILKIDPRPAALPRWPEYISIPVSSIYGDSHLPISLQIWGKRGVLLVK